MTLAEDPALLTLAWGLLLSLFCGVLGDVVPLALLAGAWVALLEGGLAGCTFFWITTADCALGGVGQGIKAPVFAFMTGGHCGSASNLAWSLSILVQAVKPSSVENVRVGTRYFVIVDLFYEKAVSHKVEVNQAHPKGMAQWLGKSFWVLSVKSHQPEYDSCSPCHDSLVVQISQ